jgi:hypothetical protein
MQETEIVTNSLIVLDGLTKGLYSGIGKDLWEKIKGVFTSATEKKALENYENNLSDEKLEAVVKYILKEKIIANEFDSDFIKLLEEHLLLIIQKYQLRIVKMYC